jgi:hypothetical protein
MANPTHEYDQGAEENTSQAKQNAQGYQYFRIHKPIITRLSFSARVLEYNLK